MNNSIREATFGKSNKFGLAALAAGLATVGILAGVGIWEATESGSTTRVSPAVARPVVPETPYVQKTLVYLVDSQAQRDEMLMANFESQMAYASEGYALDHSTRVIDVSTPEGQREVWLLNEALNEQAAAGAVNAPIVDIVDLTGIDTPAFGSAPAVRSFEQPSAPVLPTWFYIVDSKEQGDKVLRDDSLAQSDLLIEDQGLHHHAVVIDVSTPEGQQMLNVVSGESHDPSFDQSLIRIIDARE